VPKENKITPLIGGFEKTNFYSGVNILHKWGKLFPDEIG